MTLTPAAYRDLFAPLRPRLFRDSDLFNDILGHGSTGSETTNCVHCHAAVGHGPQR